MIEVNQCLEFINFQKNYNLKNDFQKIKLKLKFNLQIKI